MNHPLGNLNHGNSAEPGKRVLFRSVTQVKDQNTPFAHYNGRPVGPHTMSSRRPNPRSNESFREISKNVPIVNEVVDYIPDGLVQINGELPLEFINPSNNDNAQKTLLNSGGNEDSVMPHYVLIPMGKTGDGKSSLLNAMFGYDQFLAKTKAKSVTENITERTSVWTTGANDAVITVADTPGFADSYGRSTEFNTSIKDYILDVGSRLGIDAFLLVFKFKASWVLKVLKEFDEMMRDIEPDTWWNHVILVFTCVDYNSDISTDIFEKKLFISNELIKTIQTEFNLSTPPTFVFVSSKQQANCGHFSGKGICDCKNEANYKLDRMRKLKQAIAAKNDAGRWFPKQK